MCKTEQEISNIIKILQKENAAIDDDLIKKAIDSCCKVQEIFKPNTTFIDCVRERVRMLKGMN